jgi:acyl-CoA synthetase (AMP-forming)/AMP-acid ligase II
MVQGYLGDPEATDRMFKNGWFYPGDLGILQGHHELRVLGRGDDILNFGGAKIQPEALEQLILGSLTIGDVGVCSTQNAAGIGELLIGVVEAPYDDRELLQRLTDALKGHRIGGFHAVRLPRIPRTGTGKIQRDLLKRTIMDALRVAPGAS